MPGVDPLVSPERLDPTSMRDGVGLARPADSSSREQQLAAALEERLNASIRRIRDLLASEGEAPEMAPGTPEQGARLNILA